VPKNHRNLSNRAGSSQDQYVTIEHTETATLGLAGLPVRKDFHLMQLHRVD